MKLTNLIIILTFLTVQINAQDITNKLGGSGAGDTYDVTDSGNNLLLRIQGDGKVGIGTETPDANFDVHGTVKAFGAMETRATGSVNTYQASTDGFVICFQTNGGIQVYSDTDPNPSTTVQIATAASTGHTINTVVPIRKGNYWWINAVGGSGTQVLWIPLGQ